MDRPESEEVKKPEKKSKKYGAALLEDMLIDATEENIHKYKLSDVVIPTIGYKSRLPLNEDLINIMCHYMDRDGIKLSDFHNQAHLD